MYHGVPMYPICVWLNPPSVCLFENTINPQIQWLSIIEKEAIRGVAFSDTPCRFNPHTCWFNNVKWFNGWAYKPNDDAVDLDALQGTFETAVAPGGGKRHKERHRGHWNWQTILTDVANTWGYAVVILLNTYIVIVYIF